ncbi:hypothetical protein CC2G_004142 [Coprinopsis cinerea AmutBmut pab1-1]|nr:hypothetical protein CC2G_004142 [Coprinopsis cinerea AmutBmut pab1-1]
MLLENKHRQAGLPPNSLCPSRVTRVEATASSAGSVRRSSFGERTLENSLDEAYSGSHRKRGRRTQSQQQRYLEHDACPSTGQLSTSCCGFDMRLGRLPPIFTVTFWYWYRRPVYSIRLVQPSLDLDHGLNSQLGC